MVGIGLTDFKSEMPVDQKSAVGLGRSALFQDPTSPTFKVFCLFFSTIVKITKMYQDVLRCTKMY